MTTAGAGGSLNQGCQSGKSDYILQNEQITIFAATPLTFSHLEDRLKDPETCTPV